MAEITAIVAQATSTGSPSWVDSPLTRSVTNDDAARLTGLLSTQSTQFPQAVPGVPSVGATGAASSTGVAPVSEGMGIGDKMLQSMNAVGRAYKEKSMEVDKMLSGDEFTFSPMQMMKLQVEVINQSLAIDLYSKTIAKVDQGVDQLSKLQ